MHPHPHPHLHRYRNHHEPKAQAQGTWGRVGGASEVLVRETLFVEGGEGGAGVVSGLCGIRVPGGFYEDILVWFRIGLHPLQIRTES